ncbi:MAG TPA: heavy metal-binding domain-containing protein [Prolixibacteraceae bacterium]|nr:heavy metal-binding domain-containing protein [Prolixibacteraceae bacterium]
MMKNKFLFPAILVAGLLMLNLSATRVYGQTTEKKTEVVKSVTYTCRMHPEIIKDKPGKCPICGMKLVVKKVTPAGTMKSMPDSMMKHNHNKMMNDTIGKSNVHMKM